MREISDARVSEWRTRKGLDRAENRDAAGLYVGTHQLVAVIADGTESGAYGVAYVNQWVREVIKVAQAHEALDPVTFIKALRRAHQTFRNSVFLREKAAYAILVLDTAARTAWAVNCGDCRVGTVNATNAVSWLTPVHTAANALGEDFTRSHAAMDLRHILTRRLRMQRFDMPDITDLDWTDASSWVLATDGYWAEHLLLEGKLDTLKDDASVLFLTLPLGRITQHGSCSNFLVAF